MSTAADIEAAWADLTGDRRMVMHATYLRALKLAGLREQHHHHHRLHLSDPDADAWDAWLIRVGTAALELRHSYQRRTECDYGTALQGCTCPGCLHAEALEVLCSIEGSGRGSAGIASMWTEGERLREGLRLHNAWVGHGR
jgi:hypothetical protein